MRKEEFIEELRCGLEGRLSEGDIREITTDYGDVFANGLAEGKDEETLAEELGSPAKIARTILEEDEWKRKEEAAREAERRAQAAEEEARAARAAEARARASEASARAAAFVKPGIEPKYAPYVDRMASMGRRLGAYLVDGGILALLILTMGLVILGVPPFIADAFGHGGGHWKNNAVMLQLLTLVLLFLLMGCFNILSAIFIWATDGYTPGKWLFKIRVVKLNGKKITFMDAILRELLIKSIASGMTSGLLNLFSFIWGCVSDVRKTVHDLVAETTVICVERK